MTYVGMPRHSTITQKLANQKMTPKRYFSCPTICYENRLALVFPVTLQKKIWQTALESTLITRYQRFDVACQPEGKGMSHRQMVLKTLKNT